MRLFRGIVTAISATVFFLIGAATVATAGQGPAGCIQSTSQCSTDTAVTVPADRELGCRDGILCSANKDW